MKMGYSHAFAEARMDFLSRAEACRAQLEGQGSREKIHSSRGKGVRITFSYVSPREMA